MIDFHTHILNNIDDGPKTVEESFEMATILSNQGVSVVVCTPHFMPDEISIEKFLSGRDSAVSNLKLLTKDSIDISFVAAAEVYCQEDLVLFNDLSGLCIEGTNLLMLEFPTIKKWPLYIWKVLDHIINKNGLQVIIAHAERYHMLHKRSYKYLYKLLDMGCLIQVNGDSFTDKHYSKITNDWLRKDLIQIIGSDSHGVSHRPPNNDATKEYIIQNHGENAFQKLQENAAGLLKKGTQKEKGGSSFLLLPF